MKTFLPLLFAIFQHRKNIKNVMLKKSFFKINFKQMIKTAKKDEYV